MSLLTLVGFLLQSDGTTEIAPSPFRIVIRVLLGVLMALLLSYIVIEQLGTWMRRRSGRD